MGYPMRMPHVTTTVRRLAGRGKGFTAEFLVDTGAVDCLAPAKAIRKAGIKPEGKRVCELADGRPVELEYGFARISLMGEETVTPIVFGPEGSEPVLGVLALEGLGISVDPKTRSLKREHARSLKQARPRLSLASTAAPPVLIRPQLQLGVGLADGEGTHILS
jgi:clan AA aspartic protease